MLRQRQEIAQFIEFEQPERGLLATEVTAFPRTKETMPQADDAFHSWDMDAVHEGEHLGVAAQVATEFLERAKTFLCLTDEVGVVLVVEESGGIVGMDNPDACLSEALAKEHVLIAIMMKALVEGILLHQGLGNQEVARVEMHEGTLPALLCSMHRLTLSFVQIAQVALLATTYDIATIAYLLHIGLQPATYEIVGGNGHVAIHEQQPGILRLVAKEIADGSTAHILLTANETHMGESGQLSIIHYPSSIIHPVRPVVGYDNLVVETLDSFRLPA